MLYTGIDLHKRTVVIATVDETSKVHSEASLPTSRSAVARYFHWLPEPTVATVEATSSWHWLRDLFEQQDVPLTLAHAKFVGRAREGGYTIRGIQTLYSRKRSI